MASFFALTGTPGTGKSSTARALRRIPTVEVQDLARHVGAATRSRSGWSVDLEKLARDMAADSDGGSPVVIVGHLAHLLPVRGAVVLRCNPMVLDRRLRRARRGSAADRHDNVVAEAIDLILLEALRACPRVWEIDTTDVRASTVARQVETLVRRAPRSLLLGVDWLSDPSVTEYLLA